MLVSRRFLLIFTLFAFAMSANAQVVHRGGRFQLTLPQDWILIPDFELNKINAEMAKLKTDVPLSYVAGYRRKDTVAGIPPYVMIRIIDRSLPRLPLEELERELPKQLGIATDKFRVDNPEAGKDLSVGSAIFDRSKCRLITRLSTKDPIHGSIPEILYSHIGKDCIVVINCLDLPDTFAANSATFLGISDSFQFNPGEEYSPRPPWTENWQMLGIGALVIIACLVVVIYFIKLATRPARRRNDSRRDYEDENEDY